MLRRVVRILRMLLLVLGAGILLWMPFSWLLRVGVSYPTSHARSAAFAQQGVLVVWHINDPRQSDARLNISKARSSPWAWPRMHRRDLLLPRITKEDMSTLRGPGSPAPGPPPQSRDLALYLQALEQNPRTIVPVRARTGIAVRLPLWLLAAVCLAWPVTSLLLARRRRKGRGFAVEPLAERMKDEG